MATDPESTVTIPLNSTVTLRRSDGSVETYVFKGTDAGGPIYIDAAGTRHHDLGMYKQIKIDNGPWQH